MPSPPKAPSQFFASRPPSTASPWCQCQHFCFCKSAFSAPTLSSEHGWHFCLCACHIPKGKVHHGSNTAERWTKGRTKIRLWDLGDHQWCAREHFYEMSREAILGSYVLYTQPKITSLTSNLFIFCCYSFYPIFKFLLLINSKSQSLSCFPSYLYYTVVSYVSSIYGGRVLPSLLVFQILLTHWVQWIILNHCTLRCVCAQSLSPVWLFATLWTVTHKVPLPMEFSRQEYWSRLPFSSPGDLPDPGIKLTSPALAGGFFTAIPPRKLASWYTLVYFPFLVTWT